MSNVIKNSVKNEEVYLEFEKTKHEIWHYLLETLESSTVHGISNFIKNPHIGIKIIWIVFMAISGGYCTYTIYASVDQYLMFSTVTQVDITFETKMEFPIVKICKADIGIPYNNFAVPNAEIYLATVMFMRLLAKESPDSAKAALGIQSLSDTLVSCVFNLKICNLTEDFQHYYDWSYGNCYMFNSGYNRAGEQTPKKNSVITGPAYGLQLEFYTPSIDKNDHFTSNENGFSLLITDKPMDSTVREGLRLPSGKSTNIILNKYSIDWVPKPYSFCTGGLDTEDSYGSPCYKASFKSSKKSGRLYNFPDCKNMCFQIYLGKVCKCQGNNNDPYYPDMRNCDYSDRDCSWPALVNFTAETKDLEACDCPIECSRVDYEFDTHFSDYPTLYYANTLSAHNSVILKNFPNATYDDLTNSLTAVNIYYETLQFIRIGQDKKMIFSDLLAICGGNLGLFLGMSLLTHAEAVEIFIQTMAIVYKRKFSKSQQKKTLQKEINKKVTERKFLANVENFNA